MNYKFLPLLCLLFLSTYFTTSAQITAPNIDFETGTTANWNYYRGTNTNDITGAPIWTLASCPPDPTLHALMSGIGTDYWGGFPVVADGSYSLRLGKDTTLYNADAADYHVHVPTTGVYSLLCKYAVVLQDPGHGPDQQPRFEISITDSATGAPLSCNSFTFVSSSVLPGFQTSTVSPNPIFKPWTTKNIDLSGLAGKTVIISFKAGACGAGGHWGYGYVDMSASLYAVSVAGCSSGTTTLEGPLGDSLYRWTDSATYSITYGTTRTVSIPTPTVTTTYAIIAVPHFGYGCTDTMYARVGPALMTTHPSNDTAFCTGGTIKMWGGGISTLPMTYNWSPSSGLSCSTCDTVSVTPSVGIHHYYVSTIAGGCTQIDTINVTVYPNPGPIGGSSSICSSGTGTLSDAVTGGSWSTGSTLVTVGSVTGLVTGLGVLGTATITYSFSGLCPVYKTVTVIAGPVPFTGSSIVCVGQTATLSDATPGGVWSSSSTAFAVVGSSTGVVTGVFAGTPTITYTQISTGCYVTRPQSVINTLGTIAGTSTVCQYTTSTNLNSTPGGVWSSSSTVVATIDPVTGVLSALTPGSTSITYTLVGSGCTTSKTVNVILAPLPIIGITSICVGSSTMLSDASPGGTWSSSVTSVATVGSSSGIVSGISSSPTNISVITYAFPTTCKSTVTVTVNPLPLSINGTKSICFGLITTLTDLIPGGTWSCTANANITTPPGTSPCVVQGVGSGTATVSYILGTGCYATTTLTINSLPSPIVGPTSLCVSSTATLSDAIAGGTWSSSNTVVATINSSTGFISALSTGTSTITYKLTGSGCLITSTVSVGMGGSISGSTSLCTSTTITMSSTTGGGTWSSSNTSTAAVGSSSGIVSGVSAGTANITYSITGCGSSHVTVTVYPVPSGITGTAGICAGSSVTLSNGVAGGDWSSGNTTVATIGLSSGIIAGLSAGTADITYGFGPACSEVYTTVTVSPLPAGIAGSGNVCTGNSITLSDATTSGVWSSSNTAVATVTTTGDVAGITTGTSEISYTLGTGCLVSVVVTVDPSPSVTASLSAPCGSTVTLTAAGATGYSWSPTTDLSCPTCAATTLSPSVTTTYTVTGTDLGCSGTATVTVNGDRIYGHISFGAAIPDTLDMKVWLIQYNPADSSITTLDSTLTCTIDSIGYYEFDGKATGNYLVKAVMLYGNTVGGSGYIPTYGFSTPYWDTAVSVNHTGASDSLHITMIYGTVLPGPGFIGGYVYSGAGKGTDGDAAFEGMMIYLKDAGTNQVLTHVYTDATGAYSFSGIANGNYVIYPAEYQYKTTPSSVITLSTDNETISNINFKRHTSPVLQITPITTTAIKPVAISPAIHVYPNPASEQLNIQWSNQVKGTASVAIADVLGREVYKSVLNVNKTSGEHQVNIKGLKDGLYLISVSSVNINYISKLLIIK